ncbi:carbohydrate sulfotransferase 4 [Bactrocera neohumeralis]|uniref:carbohydrate sulfotransferase 4 n=1 Tax=Bactrocera tryoni TaxID=59916 RepID=UPI001A957F58|nr:carbohydrate sulfotransferase 4 [Bactrocera tryoni]XP_039951238.1 carbohydrate sulfotransferase 4 [Bactrocera tryoni]XP_039951239.1 carbohydrate sulfotransferase 4 [Bactrocera tryoni]XP_039951241.1 carbohydrate sulfotransferase 4 [Bactrocera tryoni]XP_050320462.1 carbohydrate sulfotransferase 4 [Bactrocera neohumeralis]XP_050320463.1 carbohydrate sulfotransferase 4 [Bactrocera neohumeralis]XP_050320464.1 carbohydrate sulfotransferase 4 [Bactrocera neohumeralis]
MSKTDSTTISLLTGASVDSVSRTRAQQRISLTTKRRKMSRRANLIGICGVSSLCILLLIATTQHRPASMTISNGMSVGVGDISGVQTGYVDRHHVGTASVAYNMTATIADVLAAQRSKILTEMENFEYPQGRFGVDAEKLSDMTPETNGTPVRSVIITTWRSGSTFLGDILNAMPGNFYHYEPLLSFGINQVRDPSGGSEALHMLRHLLHCNYTDMQEYLEYGKEHSYLFEHNERLWSVCKEFPHYCWRPKFLSPTCKLFPMQSMKVVRLRLSLAKALLDDKSLNVRMILLVRDPRGTMQSRKHRDWCAGNRDCENPHYVCQDLVDDYHAAVELLKEHSSRFRTLRYEDLSLNTYDMTQEVLQFYGLPFDPLVEEFLDTHTKVNIGGVSSTYRDSKSAPFHWKQDLRPDEIQYIQNNCEEAMQLWGYRKIDNFTNFQQATFDPIELPPPFS